MAQLSILMIQKSFSLDFRLQRNVMVELSSFQEKLLSTVSFDDGFLIPNVSPDYVQNIVLDILIWITFIQMNDKR